MNWLQESEHARSREEQELLTSWTSLEQEALEVIGRWQELDVDRVLEDVTHFLSHGGSYDRRLLDATSGFMGSDGKCVFRINRSKGGYWDGNSFHEALANHLIRNSVSPAGVAYAFVERGIYKLKNTEIIDERYRSNTYRRVFSIALTREQMFLYSEKESRVSIPVADIESSSDLKRHVDLFISNLYQTGTSRGGVQGRHENAIDSHGASPIEEENPQNATSGLDLSYEGGQHYLEEDGERHVLDEGMWRRMEEDQRDEVRYELERRAAEDPNFRWPEWVPRSDAHGPIESRRRSLDRTFGSTPRSDYDQYPDEQRFREDLDRYFPSADHAGGSGGGGTGG